MQDMLEMALKKIELLEKKVERFYQMLKVDNELDFVLRGTYITDEDINNILIGKY